MLRTLEYGYNTLWIRVLKLSLVILYSSITVNGYSQNIMPTLTGVVLDSVSTLPLAHALVSIENSKGDIISFDYTTNDGGFQFDNKLDASDSLFIHAQYLGYRGMKRMISSNESYYKIALSPQSLELSKITVKSSRVPVVVNNDTITYRSSAFVDSTESNVEEMLKKLPGFQVAPSGRIQYNGKDISAVLFEGSDMFGADYRTATRSIRPQFISDVQVIKNYNDNPILGKMMNSDDIAINLKMDEKKKYIISGTAELGGGMDKELNAKYYANTNTFAVGRTKKIIFLVGADNIGLQSSNMSLSAIGDVGTSIKTPLLEENYYLSPPLINDLGLDRPVTIDAHAVSSSFFSEFNISKNFFINLRPEMNGNWDSQQNQFAQNDVGQGAQYNLVQNSVIAKDLLNALGEIELSYFNADKGLRYNSLFNYKRNSDFTTQRSVNIFNNVSTSNNSQYDLKYDTWFFKNELTKKYSDAVVSLTNVDIQWMDVRELMDTDNNTTVDFFRQSIEDQVFQQELNIQTLESRVSNSIIWTKAGATSQVTPYFKSSFFPISNNQLLKNDSLNITDVISQSETQNIYRLGLSTASGISLGKKTNLAINADFNKQQGEDLIQQSYNYALSARLNISVSEKNSIILRLSNLSRTLLKRPIDFNYATSDLSFQKSINQYLNNNQFRDASLFYRFADPMNFNFFNVHISLKNSGQFWTNDLILEENVIVLTPILIQDQNELSTNARAERFFNSLKTKLDIRYAYSIKDSDFFYETTQFKQRTRTHSVFFHTVSQVFKPWSLGYTLRYNRSIVDASELISQKTIHSLVSSFKVKNFLWRTTLENQRVNINNRVNTWTNVHSSFRYTGKLFNRTCTYFLNLHNILNEKVFTSNFVDERFTYETTIESVPFFGILTMDFTF